jgi:beta-1,4-mannosyltransferase
VSPSFARFFEVTGSNRYFPLLYGRLAELGVDLVDDARFELGWLWRARREVAVLHFGWGPDDHYAWKRFDGRGCRMLSWLGLGLFTVRLWTARMLGYRVVWTIHEVYPPNSRAGRHLDRLAARLLARASAVLLAHDAAVAATARTELGRVANDINLVPHGSYVGVYPAGRDRDTVRAELGIDPDAFVFLCFGALRRDKEIELLLGAFRTLARSDAVLVVAGRVKSEEVGARVRSAAAVDRRIRALLEFVPDECVAELFGAADAAVLARGEVGTSASLILALSLGVPVVAARLPSHEELSGGGRAGWLFEPGDVESLTRTLEQAMAEAAQAPAKSAAALEQAARLPSWSYVAENMASHMLAAAEETSPRDSKQRLSPR